MQQHDGVRIAAPRPGSPRPGSTDRVRTARVVVADRQASYLDDVARRLGIK